MNESQNQCQENIQKRFIFYLLHTYASNIIMHYINGIFIS